MQKSPIMWITGQVAWLITALASINIGLGHIGMMFLVPMWAKYLIGASGIFCLYLLVMNMIGQQK